MKPWKRAAARRHARREAFLRSQRIERDLRARMASREARRARGRERRRAHHLAKPTISKAGRRWMEARPRGWA